MRPAAVVACAHLNLVPEPKLALDRDQAGQDALAVLAFETTLFTKSRYLVAEARDFLRQGCRPSVGDAALSAGAGAAPR